MSIEETKVLDNLAAVGSGLEDLELIDKLRRDYELAPPLNTKGIDKNHIRALGAKPVLFAFQVPETMSSGKEDQIDMVNLSIFMPKRSGARPTATLSAALSSSSRGERSG